MWEGARVGKRGEREGDREREKGKRREGMIEKKREEENER